MEFRDSRGIEKLSKDDDALVSGGVVIINEKPTQENELGVYKDGEAWVVGFMRERGQIFEVGRFVKEDTANQVAKDYQSDLEKMFNS